jgi:hypothetical protein
MNYPNTVELYTIKLLCYQSTIVPVNNFEFNIDLSIWYSNTIFLAEVSLGP